MKATPPRIGASLHPTPTAALCVSSSRHGPWHAPLFFPRRSATRGAVPVILTQVELAGDAPSWFDRAAVTPFCASPSDPSALARILRQHENTTLPLYALVGGPSLLASHQGDDVFSVGYGSPGGDEILVPVIVYWPSASLTALVPQQPRSGGQLGARSVQQWCRSIRRPNIRHEQSPSVSGLPCTSSPPSRPRVRPAIIETPMFRSTGIQ